MLGSNTVNLFDTIPDEIYLHILGNLNPIEIANIRRVSLKFRGISLDPRFLAQCLNNYFPVLSVGIQSNDVTELRGLLKQGAIRVGKCLSLIDEIRKKYYPTESFETIKNYLWNVIINRNSSLQTDSLCLNSTQVKLIIVTLCVELGIYRIQELDKQKAQGLDKQAAFHANNDSTLSVKLKSESLFLIDSINTVVAFMMSKLFVSGKGYKPGNNDANKHFEIKDLLFLDETNMDNAHDNNNDKDAINHKLFMHYLNIYWDLIIPYRKKILFEHACRTAHQELFHFLIKKGISITSKNVYIAVEAGNTQIVDALLKVKLDARMFFRTNQCLVSCLDLAFKNKQFEMVKLLLKALLAYYLPIKKRHNLERFNELFNSVEILLIRRAQNDSLTTKFFADNKAELVTPGDFESRDSDALSKALDTIADFALANNCYDVLFYLYSSFKNEMTPKVQTWVDDMVSRRIKFENAERNRNYTTYAHFAKVKIAQTQFIKENEKGKDKINKIKASSDSTTVKSEFVNKNLLTTFHAMRERSSVPLLNNEDPNVKKVKTFQP